MGDKTYERMDSERREKEERKKGRKEGKKERKKRGIN